MSSPAVEILRAELAKSQQLIDGLQAELRAERTKYKSLEEAINVLCGASPSEELASSSGSSTLKDIVLDAIKSKNGISAAEVTAYIQNQGRKTDHNTVLGTLSRLKSSHFIVKIDKLWYVNSSHATIKDERASVAAESPQSVGDVAELESWKVSKAHPSEQHPIGSRENEGSSPSVSTFRAAWKDEEDDIPF